MRCIILSLWPVGLYHIFPHYLINGTILGKKLLNIKCVFWFSLKHLSETFLILRRIEQDIIINVHRSSYTRYSCHTLSETWIIFDRFSRNTRILNLMKILPVGAELFHADGQTDMTKLIVAFRKIAKKPKNCKSSSYHNGVINDPGIMEPDTAYFPTFRKNKSTLYSRVQRP
jgi:hypothetical protein